MEKIDDQDITIVSEDLYEFPFDTFTIFCRDKSEWYAESHLDESIYIIENQDFKFDNDLNLFDEFILTKEFFNNLKEFVLNYKED